MFRALKQYATNRYCVLGFIAAILLIGLCFKYGTLSQGIALATGTAVIGGLWCWMKSMATPTVKCACGKVTGLGGYGPCGCQLEEQSFGWSSASFEKRRTETHS